MCAQRGVRVIACEASARIKDGAWMSACGGKADVEWCREESPLMTQSGHSPACSPRELHVSKSESAAWCLTSTMLNSLCSSTLGV